MNGATHPLIIQPFNNSPINYFSALRGDGFKGDAQRLLGREGGEVEFLEADDFARFVLHQNDLITGFFGDGFLVGVAEPDGEGVADVIVIHFYLGHIRFPSLMASVG